MPAELSVNAVDRSTLVVTVAFADEQGNAVTPTAASWSLTDGNGHVVNGREDVAIGAPDASVDIVLGGDDLAHADGHRRHLVVRWTYNSSAGSGLAGVDFCRFRVVDADGV